MRFFDILSGKISYLNTNFYSNLNDLFQKTEELDSPLAEPLFQESLVLSHTIIESILNIERNNKFSEFVSIKDYRLITKSDFSDAYVILLTSLAYQFAKINQFLEDNVYSDLFKILPNVELSKGLLNELNLIKEFDLLKIDRVIWKMLVKKLKIIESPGPASLVYFSGFKNIVFIEILKKFKNTIKATKS